MASRIPILITAAAVLGLQGCVSYFVQNSRIHGPQTQNLPNFTEDDPPRWQLRPSLYVNPKPSMGFNDGQHFRVDSNGNYRGISYYDDSLNLRCCLDTGGNNYRFRGDNVFWASEPYIFGLEANFQATSKLTLEYNFQLSLITGDFFWAHTLGWGLGRTVAGIMGIRADIHASLYQQYYSADMVKRKSGYSGFGPSEPDTVWFYSKSDERLYLGSGIQFTANSLRPFLTANFFASFEMGTFKYFSNSNLYTGASLGFYKTFSKRIRWLGGMRMRSHHQEEFMGDSRLTFFTGLDYGVN